eukprot:10066952-Alexandrium_andersonii.AAC.1
MNSWGTAPPAPGSGGPPTVINVSLQASAAFHIHDHGSRPPMWSMEQTPAIAAAPLAAHAQAALKDAPLRW